MSEMKIYIELSDDLKELLIHNNLSIQEILNHENIDVFVEDGAPLYQDEKGTRTRDLITIVSIIGASSTAFFTIAHAISKVLGMLQKKPIYQTYWELEEIRNNNGNIILNKEGNPIMKKVKKHIFIEPGKGDKKDKFEITSGLKGLVMKFSSEEKRQENG